MKWLLPKTLRGQIILLIVIALALAQALTLWLFVDQRALAVRSALTLEATDRTGNTARLLEDAPQDLWPDILKAASSTLVQFAVSDAPSVADGRGTAPSWVSQRIRAALGNSDPQAVRVELNTVHSGPPPPPAPAAVPAPAGGAMMGSGSGQGPGAMTGGSMQGMRPMRQPGSGQPVNREPVSAIELNLSVALSDGNWLNVTSRFRDPPYQWVWKEAAPFALTAALLAAVLWFALARLVGPLKRLGRAADRLGRGEDVEPLPLGGPAEMRQLATSFNDMQARLDRFVRERTQMLGALSHDLRSPLTALRVRVEMVDDDETRERMTATIEEMREMVEATLSFSRGATVAEPAEDVSLRDFLLSLAETCRETGGTVHTGQIADIHLRLRVTAMRRALRNLVENAIRYGHEASVSASVDNRHAVIFIDDKGPGIPDDNMERVFEPFVRLETSRSRETGGVGLGLAIARTTIFAHGGDIALENRAEGGLRVTVTLPLNDQE
ncbi:HAMP domain-containing protein [Martelella alba]|uniref:histidine kinase n=1 Tax=Martelella alba TaxID=2590451 RepID=A0A506U926_9HYPH|nr:ATP-binding protein [Martelella alba]TPW29079.1 HAMP domain-containing protein [Martelella alba]